MYLLLSEKKFMTEMNWIAQLQNENGFFFIIITDMNDQLIRKLDENGMWELILEKESTPLESNKGNLLKRTA